MTIFKMLYQELTPKHYQKQYSCWGFPEARTPTSVELGQIHIGLLYIHAIYQSTYLSFTYLTDK